VSPPPGPLVQLHTNPSYAWVGRLVFHPMTQVAGVPYWREADIPEVHAMMRVGPRRDEQDLYLYDAGIVTLFWWEPALSRMEVQFRLHGTEHSTLHYGAHNLWCLSDRALDTPWLEANP